MSIFYKDTDSQNYIELSIGSDKITTDKLVEILRKKEGLSDLEEMSILNPNTKESKRIIL